MFSIDPDAHDAGEIGNVRWGVTMARKGGIPKDRILNCLDLPDFTAWLDKRRQRAKQSEKAAPRWRVSGGTHA